jgi:hypothetical protein
MTIGRYARVTAGRATTALLRGVYRLDGAAIGRAKRRAIWSALAASVVGALAALVASAMAW